MNKSLIDTDILSEVIKGFDQIVARDAASYRRAFGYYTLAAITAMEIVQGFQKKQSFDRLLAFLALLATEEVIAFDQSDGELAGRIAGELERVGRPIDIADSMIAAIALKHGLEIVSGNIAHFQRVQQIGHPLKLANWRV